MDIVSADQFVDGLIAALSLLGKTRIDMDNRDLDQQFARAYAEFLEKAEDLDLVPDFVMTANADYGDSTCLRDTILSARDIRAIALNNPRFVTLQILMKGQPAEERLEENQIPAKVLHSLAKKYLARIAE